MNLEFSVTGNGKTADKASVLLAQSKAGVKIKPSAWPAWMRRAEGAYYLKASFVPASERDFGKYGEALRLYAAAMGKDEGELDQRAISWDAYGEWCANDPRDGRCNVCSKGTMDGAVCDSCAEWSEAIVDTWSRTRQEAMLKAHLDAELAA